jgi:YebC/PmpR family DNA-binding regulatory protein
MFWYNIFMSGHSKWSTIKRQKGLNDSKRGVVFTRLGNLIASAAKGGVDPTMNPTLAMVIDKAKAANMPLSNIERAIARVSDKNAAIMQEVMYEGYAPGGIGVLVECATDNLNRTYPEVKHAFNKTGGSIAEKGAVGFQFTRRGIIRVVGNSDDLTMQALDAGADDVIELEGESIVYTEPKDLMKVRGSLIGLGIKVTDAELGYIPNSTIEVDDETGEKVMKLLEALEDLDDVMTTHTNLA